MENFLTSATPKADICVSDNHLAVLSDTPEYHPENKSVPSPRKLRKSKTSTQTVSASPILHPAAISSDADLKPYWNEACEAMQSKLWCPIRTDCRKLDSSSSGTSSSPAVEKSSFLIRQVMNPDSSTCQHLLDLLPASATHATESEVVGVRKIRIYPENERLWTLHLHASRRAYNCCVEILRNRTTKTQSEVRREIRNQVASEYAGQIAHDCLDEAVNCAYRALSAVISKRKRGEKCELNFRSRKDTKQSFTMARLRSTPYPKILGGVHITEAIPQESKGRMADVVFQRGRWFMCVKINIAVKQIESQDLRPVAVDPGVRTFATTFSFNSVSKIGGGFNTRLYGMAIRLEKLLSQRANLLNLFPREFKDRTQWMWDRLRHVQNKCDKIQNRMSDLVDDLHRQCADYLTSNWDIIFLPTFETQEMSKRTERKIRSKTVRQMLGLGHYRFKVYLKWIAKKRGKVVIDTNESYTSKTHSQTGFIVQNLGGSKSILGLDRDVNGARGILLRSLTRQLEPEITTTLDTKVANVAV